MVRNLEEGNLRYQTNNYGTGGNDDRKVVSALFIYLFITCEIKYLLMYLVN